MRLALILIIPAAATLLTLPNRRIAPWITLAAALAVFALAVADALRVAHGDTLQAADGFLSLDPLAALYLLLAAFVGVTAALYSIGYLRAHRLEQGDGEPPRYRQYFPLFNLFLASILAVPIVADLAIVWIAIELTTIFSAFLVAYENRAEALEAAWKYVALTSMGAMIALLGVLVLYYAINGQGQPVTWPGLVAAAPGLAPALLLIPFALWLLGFGAKAGLVPVHTWLPDAHSQAPAPICALLSGVETSAALYMLLRIYPALAANPAIANPAIWYLVTGLVTVATAAFLLLQVSDYKRLFAYSTVEHMGIIITACGLGGAGGRQLGTVYQLFAHAFTKSFCFYAAGLATIVFATQRIDSVGGLISRTPVLGWALLAGALAIAGAPPFALFVAEFEILRTGFAAGQYAATGVLTALIVVAFVAIVYQVGRIVFCAPAGAGNPPRLPVTSVAALVLAFVPMLVFGFYLPPPLAALIHHAALTLEGTP